MLQRFFDFDPSLWAERQQFFHQVYSERVGFREKLYMDSIDYINGWTYRRLLTREKGCFFLNGRALIYSLDLEEVIA